MVSISQSRSPFPFIYPFYYFHPNTYRDVDYTLFPGIVWTLEESFALQFPGSLFRGTVWRNHHIACQLAPQMIRPLTSVHLSVRETSLTHHLLFPLVSLHPSAAPCAILRPSLYTRPQKSCVCVCVYVCARVFARLPLRHLLSPSDPSQFLLSSLPLTFGPKPVESPFLSLSLFHPFTSISFVLTLSLLYHRKLQTLLQP